ncbi:MAG: M48 family metallopeptidase [Enterobacterales bacterium]|nr:M48 family metallopeptidase [Enterobacterales bacterium]
MIIKGYYLDGVTSMQCDAFIEVGQMALPCLTLFFTNLDGEKKKIPLDFASLAISSRLGNTPREIAIDDCQIFVTQDNAAIDQVLSKYSQNSHSLLHQLESKLSLVLVSTLVTITLIWSFVVYGIPASAKYVAHRLPQFTTERFGSSLDLLDRTMFDPSELSQQRQDEIQALAAPYLNQYKELGVKLNFRSGLPPNALALPSGNIVFTDAFVKLAKNNQELVAVLFHEIGHLEHKHMTRRVLQDSFFTIMVVLISGDVDTIDILTGIPTLIVDLSWSREFEIEADRFALQTLHDQGIPLHYFADIMSGLANLKDKDNCEGTEKKDPCENTTSDKLSENDKDSEQLNISDFLSTHPATEDRVKMTEEMIKHYQNLDQSS